LSVPVVLGVILNIQAALQSLSRTGGYFNDVKSTSVVLDPISLETINPTDTPFTVVDEEPGEGKNDFGPSTSRPVQLKNRFTIRLRTRLDVPGDDPGRLRTAGWQWYADVEKVLLVDPQRGARALYTYVQWPSIYLGLASQSQVYVEIPIEILLNRVYGVP
jgi:hypothetical protein